MGLFDTTQRLRCPALTLVALATLGSACGLSKQEAYLAETNAQIQVVYELSENLARQIYALPATPAEHQSLQAVISAYEDYRAEINRLNVLIFRLIEVTPELSQHIGNTFEAEVQESLALGEASVAIFHQSEIDMELYNQALTHLCLSIERYAAAVTGLSREYAHLRRR